MLQLLSTAFKRIAVHRQRRLIMVSTIGPLRRRQFQSFFFLNLFLQIQPLSYFLLHTSILRFHNTIFISLEFSQCKAETVIPLAPENRIQAAALKPRVPAPSPPSTWAASPGMGVGGMVPLHPRCGVNPPSRRR